MRACPVCASMGASEVLQVHGVPEMCNLLYSSREAALGSPRRHISLTLCLNCGHLWNVWFDPSHLRYEGRYENALHFSPSVRAYTQTLAAGLIQRYDLRGRRILEIGCADGNFLTQLCRLGGNRGVGVDPAAPAEEGRVLTAATAGDDIVFFREEYSSQFADLPVDLVCFRHLLEHFDDPAGFLRTLPRRGRPVVFCEVPNAEWMLRGLSLWDVIYEHASFFTAPSLAALFRGNGFDILDLREEFGGQYLCLEARADDREPPAPAPRGAISLLAAAAESFGRAYHERVGRWRATAAGWRGDGRRAVVWGAGSKGVSFLNALDVPEAVAYVVDVNPRKQGGFVPGTGHAILAPEAVRSAPPDVLIVMNPIYEEEVRQHAAALGITAAVVSA